MELTCGCHHVFPENKSLKTKKMLSLKLEA